MGQHDCRSCKKSAKPGPNKKSLQCGVCSSYYHPECPGADVSNDQYEAFQKILPMHPKAWACISCSTALVKLQNQVNKNSVDIVDIKQDQALYKEEMERVKADNVALKLRMDRLELSVKEQAKETSRDTSDEILNEYDERESRRRNLVIYNCPEPADQSDQEKAQKMDLNGCHGLFNHLNLDFEQEDPLIGVRRLGAAGSTDGKPRGLLLIFRSKADRDLLFHASPKLNKDKDPYWKNMLVVSDITQRQRSMEAQMLKDAAARNLERSNDLISKNSAWKRTGRRGERKLRLVQLRKNEVVNQEGHVVTREDVVVPTVEGTLGASGTSNTGKRGRSKEKSGHSPNMKTYRFGEESMDTEQH